MSESGRDVLPDVRVVGWPSLMSESGREAHSDVESGWESLPDVQERSGGPPGCPGVGGRTSRMSRSGWVALPDVREWSGGPFRCPGVVGRP